MKLLEAQRSIAAALMQPWNPRRGPAREAALLIKPNHRLTSFERLEIYSRGYWCRLRDSLREDFPGLEAVLGAEAFSRMAEAYLAACPSRSFTLRDLGSRLESWLRRHPRYAGRYPVLALDMVRLEWAHVVAFDGPAESVLRPDSIGLPQPGLRLGIQPYLGLLDLQYPADTLRVAVNAAALKRRELARLRPEPVFVAVHRVDHTVYYRRLHPEEFRLLAALRGEKPLGAAIRFAFRGSPVPADEIPSLLRDWFAAWVGLGWLTPRQTPAGGPRL